MSKHIGKTCIKRIIKDLNDITKNPLDSHGIYYNHDEDDILKGSFLIVGGENTPYENGYYIFDISFPENYPFTPPVCKCITNDGLIRFNPNIYRDGKVCLSILNTWVGEQWSGCQSITTILLNICSNIFVNNPLLNEPGIPKRHPNVPLYNEIITYKNIDYTIISQLNNVTIQEKYPVFYSIMKDRFIEKYESILTSIEKDKEKVIECFVYKMKVIINTNDLIHKLEMLHSKLNNNF